MISGKDILNYIVNELVKLKEQPTDEAIVKYLEGMKPVELFRVRALEDNGK